VKPTYEETSQVGDLNDTFPSTLLAKKSNVVKWFCGYSRLFCVRFLSGRTWATPPVR